MIALIANGKNYCRGDFVIEKFETEGIWRILAARYYFLLMMKLIKNGRNYYRGYLGIKTPKRIEYGASGPRASFLC